MCVCVCVCVCLRCSNGSTRSWPRRYASRSPGQARHTSKARSTEGRMCRRNEVQKERSTECRMYRRPDMLRFVGVQALDRTVRGAPFPPPRCTEGPIYPGPRNRAKAPYARKGPGADGAPGRHPEPTAPGRHPEPGPAPGTDSTPTASCLPRPARWVVNERPGMPGTEPVTPTRHRRPRDGPPGPLGRQARASKRGRGSNNTGFII